MDQLCPDALNQILDRTDPPAFSALFQTSKAWGSRLAAHPYYEDYATHSKIFLIPEFLPNRDSVWLLKHHIAYYKKKGRSPQSLYLDYIKRVCTAKFLECVSYLLKTYDYQMGFISELFERTIMVYQNKEVAKILIGHLPEDYDLNRFGYNGSEGLLQRMASNRDTVGMKILIDLSKEVGRQIDVHAYAEGALRGLVKSVHKHYLIFGKPVFIAGLDCLADASKDTVLDLSANQYEVFSSIQNLHCFRWLLDYAIRTNQTIPREQKELIVSHIQGFCPSFTEDLMNILAHLINKLALIQS